MSDGVAVALGMFDGLHLGHQAVLNSATKENLKSVAITFSSLPFKTGGWLMTKEQKEAELKKLGIDEVFFLDFCEVCDMYPEEFLSYISKLYPIKKICCGFNYRFGIRAGGDTAFLKEYCKKKGIEFEVLDMVEQNGQAVSSTYIRSLISNGKIKKATALLSRPFSFKAKVSRGDQRGRTIGFPTLNQVFPEEYVTPKKGVYAVRVTFDGNEYFGVCNVGSRPTVDDDDRVIAETHLLDFSGELYGKEVRVEFHRFLRAEKKFSSLEELKLQIGKDRETARLFCKEEQ